MPTSVHPAGAVNADVVTPVATSTIASPATTPAGTVTVPDDASCVTPTDPTAAIGAEPPAVTTTWFVTDAVAPSASVTVNVTGYDPAAPNR